MADKKISQLTSATTPLAGTEELPIVQSGETRRVTSDNLTVKNLRSNATTGVLQVTGPTAATTRTMTTPDANFTVARTDAAQTFTGTQTFSGTVQAAIVDAISGTGDQLLINAKTNDPTAANNAGIGLRANSSATAASRFAQLWFDADGANIGGGDYFLVTKNGNDGTADLIQYSNSAMRFAANYIGRAAIDLTIETTGNVTVNNGNLVIGTSGKGIDFSATGQATGMTSELLADYEEGDWTPVPTRSGGALSATYTSSGTYTKVGRMVFITGIINISAIASQTGNYIVVSGLPYNIALTNYQIGGLIMKNDAVTTNTMLKVAAAGSSLFAGTNKLSGFPPENDLWTTGDFTFSMTYYVS